MSFPELTLGLVCFWGDEVLDFLDFVPKNEAIDT